MKRHVRSYLLEFQSEPSRFRGGMRYHWMISLTQKPEELLSWGHASTFEEAEIAAYNEVEDLESQKTIHSRNVSIHMNNRQ